jgi:ABC-type transport system substrate-binding protein
VRKKSFSALVISIFLLSSVLLSTIPIIQVAKAEGNGPRSDVRINFYVNGSQAYTALKNGDIDFLDWPLNSTYLDDAENDLNLSVAGSIGYGMWQFDINNNYTILDYPGVKSPTHEAEFRQAIACTADKDYIMNEIVSDQGARIDQPCHALSSSWMNETYLGEGYPYKHNLTKAAQLLDGLGFTDTDENGWRNYPSDWPGAPSADFTEYPLKVCVRIEDERLGAGRYLITQLESLGIKCNKTETKKPDAYYIILENQSYHIYTGGWSLPKLPWHLYDLYHSDYWGPWDSNYVTGMNASNLPNYPELDRLLEELHNVTSFEDAKAACKKALGYFVEKCITIPLWTPKNYYAYRKDVHGVVSLLGAGVLNKYTLLNAYKDDGTPIRIGSPNPPDQLNILHSLWDYEHQVLDTIYDGLTYFELYDPLDDQPWLASSWEIDTWHDIETGENKSKFTFHLRNDSYWIKPVTGEIMEQFTAEDYAFSIWYSYQSPDSWRYSNVVDIHHVKAVDNYTVEVYMNALSIWTFYGLTYPVFPKQVWTNFTQLAELKTEVFVEGVNATTPGYLNLMHQDVGAPVTINLVKANETELVEYVDYDMEMGKLKILNDLPSDTNITVTFWARNNSQGFYPGDLPWQDILVGNGPFYVTESVPEVGGYVQFKANPNYFLSPANFTRDVAVLDVTPSKTLLECGESVNVEVSVENQGNATANFKLELYVNTTLVETKHIYNLLPDASEALAFEWDTLGFKLGNYTVKAVAETLLDESDTSDNTYVDGTITITSTRGPRSDLRIDFYGNVSDAYAALKGGDVDFLYGPLNSTYVQDAEDDPNLLVAESLDNKMFEFDINNNYTILDYPGVKSPTYEAEFRQASAHAIDKDYIMNEFVLNHGARIDQPCHALSSSWMNETYLGESYPYKYNLTEAAQLLDGLGFVDTDENGWRNYPSSWPGAPGADFTEYPLKVCVRNDDPIRLEAGRYLVTQLESLGVKCNKIEANSSVLWPMVLANRSYHIYTGGWAVLPKPPEHLCYFFHSDYWFYDTSIFCIDYVTGMNASNLPNYPELDGLLEEMRLAASFEDAIIICKSALGYFTEKCINIPLWTQTEYYTYRKDVHGVVSLLGANVLNRYTLLNAYKDDGTPIRIGLEKPPDQLNILHSEWDYDYEILDTIYDGLTYFHVYDPLDDQPWLASSWEIDTWYDAETGENKSKFTFHLRNDSYWIKPVTGEIIGQFTAEDYAFSVWYMYQTPDSWDYSNVVDVHHVKAVDNCTVEVYMNALSIWTFYGLTYPVLPKQVWTNFTQLAELRTEVFVEGVNATTPGYLNLTFQDVGAPVAVDSVKANDTELVKYVDYDMEMGRLRILNDLSNGTTITVTFWARNNSQGFHPGDLPWQNTLVGNGPFYITESISGVGGHAYLKANPNYFLSPKTFNRDVAVLNVTPHKTSLEYGETVSIEVLVENQGDTSETLEVGLYANTTLAETKTVYSLLPNASKSLAFEWNTTGFELGNYTVKAIAETLLDETDTSDNVYIDGTITITTPSKAYVYVMPPDIRITLGVTFSIDIMIVNAADLYGFQIELHYNTTLLNAINTTEGSFLKQAGTTSILKNEINDTQGYVKFAASLLGAENGVNGSGTLFTVTFNSSLSATGISPTVFDVTKLSDSLGQPIDHYSSNGSVEVVEIDTKSFPAVKNETTYQVSTISNSTIQKLEYKESESKITLNSKGPSGYSSFCNITIPKELLNGTFAVLVNGEAIYYEKIENETHYTLCFNFTHSTVEIDIFLTLEGDLNGDRTVNIFDVVMISSAFDSKPGDPHWNPMADVVKDGEIDIYDAVVVCRQYGKTWSP